MTTGSGEDRNGRRIHDRRRAVMAWKMVAVLGVSALVLGLGSSGLVRAGDLITNGGFEMYTPGAAGAGDLGYSPVTGWTSPLTDAAGTATGNLLFTPGSADTTGVYYDDTPYGGGATYFGLWGPGNGVANGLPTMSPAGGNFIGLDASPLYSGALSQTISGSLTNGQTYAVGFWWAGAQLWTTSGATTEQLQVSLGAQTQMTNVVNNVSQGFTGWTHDTLYFTATGPSETLSFLALGTPSGLPPFVLLDGVTMQSVPEPSAVMLLGIGLLGIGVVRRFRAAKRAAAARSTH